MSSIFAIGFSKIYKNHDILKTLAKLIKISETTKEMHKKGSPFISDCLFSTFFWYFLFLRYRFASPPLFLRSASVPKSVQSRCKVGGEAIL
jgi:hypothetical protein